ncbi:MFS transporter [Nocardiopsis sp. FIRDI 009]|uniref:MFS transporter n=1 Tax=Nocardiopsis sp. FIRDI 009 TaxID=714197 RepID=UPI0018E54898|nr:MFS transporter [Nocardiopsis sp. FIRDI 009]
MTTQNSPTPEGGAAPPAPEPDTAPGTSARRLTLAAVLLAVFVVPTSISGTAVALPTIGADTGADLVPLQWVLNAFNVAFACFTLVWGSLADVVGRARAFALGAGVYGAASLASAFAADIAMLDVARALAGVGGAAVFACGSAILTTVFDGPARARAFALFGTVAGVGVALGPSLSGLVVEALGWRWIFGAHALALALVLAAVPVIARAAPGTGRPGARIDVLGAALFITAMLLLTTAIVQGSQWGWASARVLGLFAGTVVALSAFTALERGRENPILDLGLLTERRFVGLCLVPVAASFGFVTILTHLPSYLTVIGGYGPGAAGLVMVLLTLPVFVGPMLAASLVSRGAPALALVYASLLCLVLGDLGLLLFGPRVSVAVVAAPMLVTGAGMGLSAGLVDRLALEIVPERKAGMAAGFLNTLRLGSEAVAVAVYGSLLATLLGGRIGAGIDAFEGAGDPGEVANAVAGGHTGGADSGLRDDPAFLDFLTGAYDGAFHQVLWILAGIGVLLLLLIAALLRTGADGASEPVD